mmetsp:Transcript_28030/g.70375  ORF Transcript_28030/g.70375 Transcript_28030/m.70375 type:complete len:420 (+) Transcript_28030:147-1406(+)
MELPGGVPAPDATPPAKATPPLEQYQKWYPDSPFVEVCYTPSFGRFLVARMDIPAGTKLFTDGPYCWSVDEEFKYEICQFCLNAITDFEPTPEVEFRKIEFVSPTRKEATEGEAKKAEENNEGQTNGGTADNSAEAGAAAGTPPVPREVPKHRCTTCNFVFYCSAVCRLRDSSHHNGYECMVYQQWVEQRYTHAALNESKLLVRLLARKMMEDWLPVTKDSAWDYYTGWEDYTQLIVKKCEVEDSLIESLGYWVCDYVHKLGEWMSRKETMDDHILMVLRNRRNAFCVFRNSSPPLVSVGCAVYVRSSLFNHSCCPNLYVDREWGTPCLSFVAMQDIPAGTMLTISYLGLAENDVRAPDNLEMRRKSLMASFLFTCQCQMCLEEEAAGGGAPSAESMDNAQEGNTGEEVLLKSAEKLEI